MSLRGWSWYRPFAVVNDSGGALTNYQLRLRLNADNFDFSKAKADGADLRVTAESAPSTPLYYWIESYDSVGETALVWVLVPSIATGTSYLRVYYGNSGASDAGDGAAVFEYYNELSSSGDLADLGSSAGTATWTVVSDAGSPTGSAVDCTIGTANDASRYKTLTLPTNHIVEIHVSQETGGFGAWNGPLMNMSASNTWRRPGTQAASGAASVQIRENVAGVLTNYSAGVKSGAEIADSTFYKQITHWKPKVTVSAVSNFSVAGEIANVQGGAFDGTYVYVFGDNDIVRYNTSGTVQEDYTNNPGGTSWGDGEVVDGVLYIVRFDSTTFTRIYSLDPMDLAAGVTLEATLTTDMDTGANGLAWNSDHSYWVIGETDVSSTNIHLYFYNASWTLLASKVVPCAAPGSASEAGIQGMTFKGDILYLAFHEGQVLAGLVNPDTYDFDVVDAFAGGFSSMQMLKYDSANDRFWLTERQSTHEARCVTFDQHSTEKTCIAHWRDSAKSVGVPIRNVTSPNSQSLFGIGAFRSARFAQLFVRQQVLIEPSVYVSGPAVAVPARRQLASYTAGAGFSAGGSNIGL